VHAAALVPAIQTLPQIVHQEQHVYDVQGDDEEGIARRSILRHHGSASATAPS
jgi:hypothetical protein